MIFFRVEIYWFLRYFLKIRHFEKRFQEIENSFVMERIVSLVGDHLQTSKDLIRKDFTESLGEQGKDKGEYIWKGEERSPELNVLYHVFYYIKSWLLFFECVSFLSSIGQISGSLNLWERKTNPDLQKAEIAEGLQNSTCLCYVGQVQGLAC